MNDSLITNSPEHSDFDFFAPKPAPIPFDIEHFTPLTFKPADEVAFAVKRARELLKNRTNEQCMTIAKTASKMAFVIEALSQEGEMSNVEPKKPKDVFYNQGRALFQWKDKFEFKDIGCPQTEWFEVFAIQALMLCIEYSHDKQQQKTGSGQNKAAAIIDCLARAEVLQRYGPMSKSAQVIGSNGGRGRTKKQEPLETEVIRLYLSEFCNMPVLKAANCIATILEQTQKELLLLTKNKDKPVAIQNIIRKLKAGKSPITL